MQDGTKPKFIHIKDEAEDIKNLITQKEFKNLFTELENKGNPIILGTGGEIKDFNQTVLTESVKILTKALREDPGLYISYQANIAMAFVDEFKSRNSNEEFIDCDIHEVANTAAKNFLNLWIKE